MADEIYHQRGVSDIVDSSDFVTPGDAVPVSPAPVSPLLPLIDHGDHCSCY